MRLRPLQFDYDFDYKFECDCNCYQPVAMIVVVTMIATS